MLSLNDLSPAHDSGTRRTTGATPPDVTSPYSSGFSLGDVLRVFALSILEMHRHNHSLTRPSGQLAQTNPPHVGSRATYGTHRIGIVPSKPISSRIARNSPWPPRSHLVNVSPRKSSGMLASRVAGTRLQAPASHNRSNRKPHTRAHPCHAERERRTPDGNDGPAQPTPGTGACLGLDRSIDRSIDRLPRLTRSIVQSFTRSIALISLILSDRYQSAARLAAGHGHVRCPLRCPSLHPAHGRIGRNGQRRSGKMRPGQVSESPRWVPGRPDVRGESYLSAELQREGRRDGVPDQMRYVIGIDQRAPSRSETSL